MKTENKNLLLWAVWIAFLATTIQIMDQLIGKALPIGHTGAWFAFMAWAIYFMGGGTALGGLKGFISIVAGIVAGIVVIELAGLFSSLGFWAVPLGLFLPVIPILCFERIKLLDYIPALFIGCGAFFAIMNYVPEAQYGSTICYELFWGAIGLFYGWVAIQGKNVINKIFPIA